MGTQTEMMPETNRVGTLASEQLAPEPKPVLLKVPRDYSLVTRALENEKEELDKLAKKNQEAGYWKESRAIAGDAAAIQYEILPKFRDQQELPLATSTEVRGAIANALRDVVKHAHTTRRDPESTLETLARRVDAFLEDVAVHAFDAGMAAREYEPALFAFRSIARLADTMKDED